MSSNKRLSTTKIWAFIVGVGVVLALLNGIFDLWDHIFPKPLNPLSSVNTDEFYSIPILKTFPLFVGSSWTYSYGVMTEAPGASLGLNQSTGSYTEKIVMVNGSRDDAIRVYTAEQTGDVMDMGCHWFDAVPGPVNVWYVTDETRLYLSCDSETAFAIAQNLLAIKEENADMLREVITPNFEVPLSVGKKWEAFPEAMVPEEDTMYKWYVEDEINITVPAGSFTDCFRIGLHTLPDLTYKYVCPGIGVVAVEYVHHGSTMNYRIELSTYSIPNHP